MSAQLSSVSTAKACVSTAQDLRPTEKSDDLGTNLGVLSAQSLGERSVQVALKAFHSGGVKQTGGAGVLGAFQRTQQLTLLPKKIPDSAALAMKSGKIDKIEDEKTGTNVWVVGRKARFQRTEAATHWLNHLRE